MALAHTIANKVEAACRRGDRFAKRARLMQAWADYCSRVAEGAAVAPSTANSARPAVGSSPVPGIVSAA